MKTFRQYIYLILCLPLLWTSCSDDNSEPDRVEVVEAKIDFLNALSVFDAEGGSQSVDFNATAQWSVRSDQSWCKVTPLSGGAGKCTVQVEVTKNESTDERNSSITFKIGDKEKRLTVTQKQKGALLLSASKAEISANEQDITVEVKSNIDYSYQIDSESSSWISETASRTLDTKEYSFHIKKNESDEKRQGTIIFKSEQFTEVFTVYQESGEGPLLVLTQQEYVVSSSQSTVRIELRSNTAYQMILPDNGWIHEIPSRAMSSYTHFIEIDENLSEDQRTAEIQFVYGDKVEKVKIIQQQKDAIILSKDSYEAAAEGDTLNLKIATNVSFSVACSVDWIRQDSKSRELTETTLSFIVDENPTESIREGKIVFRSGDVLQQVRVIQHGNEIEQLFIIVHSSDSFTIPDFWGSQQLTGVISWGDSKKEDYRKGLEHKYVQHGEHKVVVNLKHADEVQMETIEGVQKLDFSGF